MRTQVGLIHESARRLPWRVYWFTPPDADGKQLRRSKSFRHVREAKVFQASRQVEVNSGKLAAYNEDVSLDRLIRGFTETRLVGMSASNRGNYERVFGMLRPSLGGRCLIRRVELRHAETFMVNCKRLNDEAKELSGWTKSTYAIKARALFGAAVEWNYIAQNPFTAPKSARRSPLRP